MLDADRKSVDFVVNDWRSGSKPWEWYHFLPNVDPTEYMHLLPEEMRIELAACDCIRDPPATIDGFEFFESAVYSQAFFEGLTEEQVEQKIKEQHRQRKQLRFDLMWAIHNFFNRANASGAPPNTSLERTRDR